LPYYYQFGIRRGRVGPEGWGGLGRAFFTVGGRGMPQGLRVSTKKRRKKRRWGQFKAGPKETAQKRNNSDFQFRSFTGEEGENALRPQREGGTGKGRESSPLTGKGEGNELGKEKSVQRHFIGIEVS